MKHFAEVTGMSQDEVNPFNGKANLGQGNQSDIYKQRPRQLTKKDIQILN